MATRYTNLAEYFDYRGRRFAEKCTSCGECLEVCPVFPLTKFAHRGSQAVMEKVTDLLQGGEVSEEAYDMVFSCNGACGECVKACPEGLIPYSAFMPALAKIAAAGREFPPRIYQHTHGHRHHFPDFFSALQIKPSEERWLRKAPANPEPVDVVLFGMPHLLLETVAILERMGLSFVVLSAHELCCGASPMLCGDLDGAQNIGRELISTIASFRPKQAVFFCTSCQVMSQWTLPRFNSIPFQTYELSHFLLENLDKIPFAHTVDKVVTLHDSYTMASLGTFDGMRTLLQAIPGLTLVEMEHNRENNLCCGGFATSMRPEVVKAARRAPLDEATATGAEIMALTCTGCQKSFAPLQHQYPFQIQNYISLVAEGVGVNYEDKFTKYMDSGDVAKVLAEARDCIEESHFSQDEAEKVLSDYFDTYHP